MNKDKLKILEKVKAGLAEKYKRPVIFKGADMKMEKLPFGIMTIDRLFGGGPVRGRWHMIYGSKSTGKSSLCCEYISKVQADGGIAAYIDAEHAYDADYAATFGVNNEELIYTKPETLEEAMTTLTKVAPHVDLVIIDSIIAIAPESELEREMEQETMALVARKLSQFFRCTTALVGKTNAVMLLVNQTRTNLGAYVPVDSYPGGQALAHACSFIMHMRRGSYKDDPVIKIDVNGKEKTIPIGNRLHIKAEKTKISSNEGERAFVDLLKTAPHFDLVRDVLNIAQLDDIVTRAGAFYYFGDQKYQGEQTLIDAMRNDPKLVEAMKLSINNKPSRLTETKKEKPSEEVKEEKIEEIVEEKPKIKKPKKEKK